MAVNQRNTRVLCFPEIDLVYASRCVLKIHPKINLKTQPKIHRKNTSKTSINIFFHYFLFNSSCYFSPAFLSLILSLSLTFSHSGVVAMCILIALACVRHCVTKYVYKKLFAFGRNKKWESELKCDFKSENISLKNWDWPAEWTFSKTLNKTWIQKHLSHDNLSRNVMYKLFRRVFDDIILQLVSKPSFFDKK